MLETLGLLIALAGPVRAQPVPPRTTPDATVQIKLRDLLGMVPTKDQAAALAEIIRRLEEITARLKVIEERLLASPLPLPPVTPTPGPLRRKP